MPERIRIAISLIFLVIFCPLAIDIYLPAFPAMARHFAVDNHQVQLTITLFMASVGLGQLIAGPLADKYGRKPIAVLGVGLYALGAVLAWFAKDFNALLLGRIIQGLGACATFVVTFAIVRDVFGADKSGPVITYLNGIVCFIPALAPLLGAWLTITYGWQANFMALTAFAVLGLLCVLVFYRESRPEDAEYQGRILDLRRFMPMLSHGVFMYHSLICLFAMSAILAFVSSAPGYLMGQLNLDIPAFTRWFTTNAVISILVSFIAPRYVASHLKGALLLGLILLAGSGFALIAMLDIKHPAAFMVPVFISSVGFCLCLGAAAGQALAPFGKQAGTASALIGVMQMSGAGLLVTLTQSFGLSAPVLVALHLVLLTPFLLLLIKYSNKLLETTH